MMAHSMRALNIPLGRKALLLYIHHPVPLHREVVLGLQSGLEECTAAVGSRFLHLNLPIHLIRRVCPGL